MSCIVVWFSCGAASAVAAAETLRRHGSTHDVRVVNNPVAEEDPDNLRFLRDVEMWLGVRIETAVNPRLGHCSAHKIWQDRKYMAGVSGASCTGELKKKARQHWELKNDAAMHVLGFTADEVKRYINFIMTERDNVLPVLLDARLTKQDCAELLIKEGLRLPEVYARGYPNANCIGCVKASSPTYWNHVRKDAPAVFDSRAALSREIGAKLARYRGERIYLDELPADAVGAPLKSLAIDCGIFCEELTSDADNG